MFCILYKWMISRGLDTGKGLTRSVSNHIRGCAACREFAHTAEALASRLVKEAPPFLTEEYPALEERIISALDAPEEPLPVRGRQRWSFNFFPVPALAMAGLVILAVTIGIIMYSGSTPSTGPIGNPMDELVAAPLVKNPLQLMEKVESPIEKEMKLLGQSVKSATDFLISNLDFDIGQGNVI